MANTLTQFPAGQTQYKINFDYLARPFVVVTLVNSNDPAQNRVLTVGNDYGFLNPTTIEIYTSQAGFDILQIRRFTSTDLVVDFRDGSVLTAKDLTNAELQAIHIAEEGRDQTADIAKEHADAALQAEQGAKQAEKDAKDIVETLQAGLAGYILLKSFKKGNTLTDWNQALLMGEPDDDTKGEYYRWDGEFPKVVPPNSTPESTGGVGAGRWLSVGDSALRSQLKGTNGADYVSYTQAGGDTTRPLSDVLAAVLNVKNFGAKGDWDPVSQTGTNDTAAFVRAFAYIDSIGGGSLYVPSGNYLIKEVEVPSNTMVYGAGATSNLWQVEEPWTGSCVTLGVGLTDENRPDWTKNTYNVVFRDLAFRRKNRDTYTSAGDAWQWRHLVTINACTAWKIIDCIFEGYNGDGVYVAGGFGANEGHNLDGEIRSCYFSGVDYQNRNAISVLDCEGLIITGCTFRNTTSQYQPAAIDIEPNARTFHRVRDIRITNNRFVACRGQASSLSVYFPDVAYTSPPTNILFADNDIDGGSATNPAPAVFLVYAGDATPNRNVDIRIVNNKMTRCVRGHTINGMREVRIEGNKLTEMRGGDIVGFGQAGKKCANIFYTNNFLTNVGYEDGMGLGVYDVDGLSIEGNTFRNIGKGTDPRDGTAIIFKSGRTGRNIRVANNSFNNEGRTVTGAITSGGYTFDPSTNFFGGNVYRGGGGMARREFPAVFGDEGQHSYTPTVYGDTVAGVGTYTAQRGVYHIEGNVVHFRVNLTLTAHTGSGPLNISLPTLADTGNGPVPVVAYTTGNIPSTTGIAVGRVDTGAVGGVGRVRLYRADGGGNVNINSAGNAMTVDVSGTYPFKP
ncbi:hypothetical protein eKKP3263_000011 [Enterobacter phage KKP_3263]|uniref:Probable tail spike protein n=1 Tax=Enterobacter phage KKP_3263 TaxID=2875358 RepID=A0ABY3P9P5_9CAUD|nr:hypothetical protein eKKP3263_000011 [Enterobacter phage KKP_3263]